jgi:two pore calcium channel protein 1
MSVPKYLFSTEGGVYEPLLSLQHPTKAKSERNMSVSRKSDANDEDFSDIQPVVQTHSFSSEPFHRFGNTGFEHMKQATAQRLGGGAGNGVGGSGDKFSGGVDANSDPEVAAFAYNEVLAAADFETAQPFVHSTFSAAINTGPGDTNVYYKDDQGRTKFEEAALYVREGELNDKFYSHPTGQWSKLAYQILHHPVFHVFDLMLSILLMLLAIIEKPSVLGAKPTEQPLVTVHGVLELVILGLLGVDIILRLIWLSPRHFVRHRRTMFITVMLFVMVIEAFVVLIRQQSHLRITRALRPVFFIDTYLMLGVRRVLRQIFQSLKVIVDVILLLFFVVAFFALIGYYLFAETDPTYFDTFGLSFVSLFITTTTANNPDVMMEAYSQDAASPIFFMAYLIITLYFITNILLAVVISNFSAEEKEKFRKLFLHKREALRHAYRVLTGRTGISFDDFLAFMEHYRPRMPEWQVMCVFKALHVNPNDQHSELQEAEFYDFYEVQNLKWREVTEEGEDVLWFNKFPPPVKKVFLKIHALVKWEWFNSIIYIVIIVNMIFLVIYSAFIVESEAPDRFKHINIVLPLSVLFLLVYIVEISLKILALGPIQYFKKFWNMCDFVVITVSLIAVCLELHPLYHSLAVVRPIKLIRIIRLKKRYRDIMNTMVILIPRLISVSLLLIVIFYFFAIVGMEAFQYQVAQGCCV